MAQLTLPPDPKTVERFWSKVDLDDPADCWIWDAALQTAGYGNVWIEGTNHTAHKVAWVWEYGPVPDGLQLDHLCRNRRCVRPDHLEPVTSRENSHRSPLTLNYINAAKTHCPKGHDYATNADERNGKRYCKACRPKAAPRVAPTPPAAPVPAPVRVCANGHPMRLLAGRYWCPPCAVRRVA